METILDTLQAVRYITGMDIIKTIQEEIEKSEKSRYRISMDTGVDQARLHRIMKQNQSLHCSTAGVLLEYFGYELHKKAGK